MSAPANHPFVPLASLPAGNGKQQEFRVLVAERPETARPLLDLNSPGSVNTAGRAQSSPCEPRVTLQRDADCITGIHIQCSCGQVIDLKCGYKDNQAK
jgi:hypothetical protein